MRLVRYNPLNELALWGNSFNNLFNDGILKPETEKPWYPAVGLAPVPELQGQGIARVLNETFRGSGHYRNNACDPHV